MSKEKSNKTIIKLNSTQIKEFLGHIITNNRIIQADGKVPVAVEITGEAGLGKTTLGEDIAKMYNLEPVILNLAQIEELGDLTGFPSVQFEMCKEDKSQTPVINPEYKTVMEEVEKILPGGKSVIVKTPKKVLVETTGPASYTDECVWVDEKAVAQYSQKGYLFTGRKHTTYCPPEWVANKQHGILLILDDYTRA